MLIGIDLLWVRPKICGGTESVIRNLMNGFGLYDDKNEYLLFAGKDTAETFREYEKYPNMKVVVCDTESMKRVKRIAWENSHLDKKAREEKAELMLIPVYSKPNSLDEKKGGIPYITVIHDLQALHYPEYFSKPKIYFAKRSWKKACIESRHVVTISKYCMDDITANYPMAKDKISVIYDPILLTKEKSETSCISETSDDADFSSLTEKYGIEKNEYFYTASSMLPHKNLSTLIDVMKSIKEKESDEKGLKNIKLVVSGVGGNKDEFHNKAKEAGVEDMVIDTGFVSNAERDALYENCRVFLFPSIFEGFGMPPIEAMMKGAPVVTTKCSCLMEVTKGEALYVDSPTDSNDWINKITEALFEKRIKHVFEEYDLKNVTCRYTELFESVIRTKE